MSDDRRYLILKRGLFYRPAAKGYTDSVEEAGRFTLKEAIAHSHPNGPDGPRDGISYRQAPEFLEALKETADAAPRAQPPIRGRDAVLQAALEEFHLQHPTETSRDRSGRRAAIRGMMVRLDLYEDFTAALRDSLEPEVDENERIDTSDIPEMDREVFDRATWKRLRPASAGDVAAVADETPSP